jgi:two-component system chemotaxis response regulator CheB
MIRVLIVDDSPLVRKIASDILQKDRTIEVAGTAPSAELALRKIERLKPDVITMDMQMPGMGGLKAIREIMKNSPTPIVVLSAFARDGAELTMQALEEGAVDFIAKPSGSLSGGLDEVARQLVDKVKAANRVNRKRMEAAFDIPEVESSPNSRHLKSSRQKVDSEKGSYELIAIGSSTGGPVALKQVLTKLPEAMPLGIAIVQHMPPVFTRAFAKRLNAICRVAVKEASEGDILRAGQVLIAPGDYHMTVKRSTRGAKVLLNREEPVMGLRPSVDILLDSVARQYGGQAIGVILTGMGKDGAAGMANLKRTGGYIIAQDRESSVIYGMNREVIENGHADEVVPISKLGHALMERAGLLLHA